MLIRTYAYGKKWSPCLQQEMMKKWSGARSKTCKVLRIVAGRDGQYLIEVILI